MAFLVMLFPNAHGQQVKRSCDGSRSMFCGKNPSIETPMVDEAGDASANPGLDETRWLPAPKEVHERASKSAAETRDRIITLSTAILGGLLLYINGELGPPPTRTESHLILAAMIFATLAIGMGVGNSFADSQWSYWWALQIDPSRAERHSEAKDQSTRWHKLKHRSEGATLVCFLIAIALLAIFIPLRLYR